MMQSFRTKARDGAIFLLHDDGLNFGADDDAPAAMMKQLEAFIKEQPPNYFANPHQLI